MIYPMRVIETTPYRIGNKVILLSSSSTLLLIHTLARRCARVLNRRNVLLRSCYREFGSVSAVNQCRSARAVHCKAVK